MWCHGVQLIPERREAWLQALEPSLKLAGAIVGGVAERVTLEPVRVADVAFLFGQDEAVATAVYATLVGDTKGLLMLESHLPGTVALHTADAVFKTMALAIGGLVAEPWLLIDMRTTLAETLATQTEFLTLGVMSTAVFRSPDGREVATFAFIPDWSDWNGRGSLEARREAA
jgi:hypothetical protein